MKRIILTASVLLALTINVVYAQQDPKFTHYMFNQVMYNPAFIGAEMGKNFCANLVHRSQWMGYSDQDGSSAPLTTAFNVHKPLTIAGKQFGAGLMATQDGLGFQTTTTFYGGFSYHHDLGKSASGMERHLIFGLNLGFIQSGIDKTKLKYIDSNDPLIDGIIGNATAFDFGAGILYKTDKYYIGFSNMHIPQSQVDWFGGKLPNSENKLNRHFYINGGYDYRLTSNLVLKPRTLIKFDRAIWQIDLGVLAEFKDKVWAGLNVRRGAEAMLLVGGKVYEKKTPKGTHVLKLGMSYDMTFNRISSVSNGSMELMANYCFPVSLTPKPPKTNYDPRFLGGYTL
ncbi:type IX secretion system membrane protein PorP/SprF [bacterium]|nr:type IX secretion system membrane protein PorP/SprF [bacterium]